MVTSPAARQHHYNHFWQSALAIWFKILHFTLWGNEKPMKMQFPNSTSILQEKKKDNSHPLMMFRWGWTQTQLEIVVRWSNKQLEEKIITTFHSELGEAVHPENQATLYVTSVTSCSDPSVLPINVVFNIEKMPLLHLCWSNWGMLVNGLWMCSHVPSQLS